MTFSSGWLQFGQLKCRQQRKCGCCILVPHTCDVHRLHQVLFKFIWDFSEYLRGWEGVSELPFPWRGPSQENASVRLKPGFPSAKVFELWSHRSTADQTHFQKFSSCVVLVRRAKRFNLWLLYFSFLSPPCRSFLFRWFSEFIPILLQESHKAVIAQSLSASLLI